MTRGQVQGRPALPRGRGHLKVLCPGVSAPLAEHMFPPPQGTFHPASREQRRCYPHFTKETGARCRGWGGSACSPASPQLQGQPSGPQIPAHPPGPGGGSGCLGLWGLASALRGLPWGPRVTREQGRGPGLGSLKASSQSLTSDLVAGLRTPPPSSRSSAGTHVLGLCGVSVGAASPGGWGWGG